MLDDIKLRHGWLQKFDSWPEVSDTAHRLGPDAPEKDQLFRTVFGDARAQEFVGWHPILLALFWLDVVRIHGQKAHWDRDAERRWSNVIWAYFRAAERLDPALRPHGLARKLFNDTIHDLYEIYRSEWDILARETPTDPAVIADQYDRPCDSMPPPLDGADLRAHAVANLRDHLQAGRIGELDYLLILGTRIYGKALAECAEEAGLAYQAAKKRRQRAEATVRDFNTAHEISPECMSPRYDSPPLGQ